MPATAQLDAWDHELAEAGEPLTRYRQLYLEELQPRVAGLAQDLAPALGRATLEYQPGWRRDELSLADALLLARDRDRRPGTPRWDRIAPTGGSTSPGSPAERRFPVARPS